MFVGPATLLAVTLRLTLALACAMPLGLLARATAWADTQTRAVRRWTVADGLPHDAVSCVLRDRRGFIWACSSRGLARIDATGVATFGLRDGLPDPVVNDLLEDRAGRLWAATNGGGVARFAEPSASAAALESFTVGQDRKANRINVLFELPHEEGVILAGTDGGLYRITAAAPHETRRVHLAVPGVPDHLLAIWTIVPDRHGDLWIGTNAGLVHHRVSGGSRLYRDRALPTRQLVRTILVEPDGRILAGFDARIIAIPAPPRAPETGASTEYAFTATACGASTTNRANTIPCVERSPALPPNDVLVSLMHPPSHPDRTIVTSTHAVTEVRADGMSLLYDAGADVLLTARVMPDEGLWIGTRGSGLVHLIDTPFQSFGTDDGLEALFVRHMFTDRDGQIYAMTASWAVARYTGGRFETRHPRHVDTWNHSGWIDYLVRTRRGDWWATTAQGLVQFPDVPLDALSRTAPIAVHDLSARLHGVRMRGLFEDSRGDIWAGSVSGDGHTVLTRWQRATGTLRHYTDADGFDRFGEAIVFAEDRAGRIWISFRDGGLARIDGDRITVLRTDPRLKGPVRTLHADVRGRLWLALRTGLVRIDDPGADRPLASDPPEARALASDFITAITEDLQGRLYFGHDDGIDRLDTATGEVRKYGAADGLPRGEPTTALTAPDGSLWFGTTRGVVRLLPGVDPAPVMPRVLFTAIRVNGVPQRLPPWGTAHVAPLTLADRTAALDVGVAVLPASLTSRPLVRYRLTQSGREAWSGPMPPRPIALSHLAPGSYRLELQALSSEALPSDGQPVHASMATLTLPFDVLAPIWLRWWFLALVGLTVSGAAFALHRYRLTHALRLERLRARIATDLHDDIGASLSHIAILAEVVRPRASHVPEAARALEQMAATSRTLIDSMSDIVWSINPKRDAVGDLVRRIRRFAEDALEGAGVPLVFDAPDDRLAAPLAPDVRRELLMIVKESVTNIVRHAQATEARITLRMDGGAMTLTVRDNGCGFDPSAPRDGNGLDNLRRRAEALQGDLRIDSAPGQGTTITVTCGPGARRRFLRRRVAKHEGLRA